jgi:hypothetical protein
VDNDVEKAAEYQAEDEKQNCVEIDQQVVVTCSGLAELYPLRRRRLRRGIEMFTGTVIEDRWRPGIESRTYMRRFNHFERVIRLPWPIAAPGTRRSSNSPSSGPCAKAATE